MVSVCRFVRQKNIKEVLKIAKKLPEINFLIIGDGELLEEIKKSISEISLKNINLVGSKKNIYDYLYKSDIYLSTSLYEGLPLSILEAMSVGLPIVASNVTGNLDTIEHGKSGYLYELKNVIQAVRYIKKLANDKYKRINFGKNAFERQRKCFSKDIMLSEYLQLYKKF